MALPANDVFSLGLAHDRPRRSSSRTRTPSLPRSSPSPKVSFPSPPSSPSPSLKPVIVTMHGSGRKGKPSSSRPQHTASRSISSTAPIEELVEEVEAQISARKARKSRSRNGSATRPNERQPQTKAKARGKDAAGIDWEIPRKALHSSIGVCSLLSLSFASLYLSSRSAQASSRSTCGRRTARANVSPLPLALHSQCLFQSTSSACATLQSSVRSRRVSVSSCGTARECVHVLSSPPPLLIRPFPEIVQRRYMVHAGCQLSACCIASGHCSRLRVDVCRSYHAAHRLHSPFFSFSLSWADTAASTFGRMYGSRTPPLPSHILGLPLAPRKSLAGFVAASLTGAAVATGFWSLIGPLRGTDLTWTWETGIASEFSRAAGDAQGATAFAGWTGIVTIGVMAGLVTGIAEALGKYGHSSC